jgi:hypothetical protein
MQRINKKEKMQKQEHKFAQTTQIAEIEFM